MSTSPSQDHCQHLVLYIRTVHRNRIRFTQENPKSAAVQMVSEEIVLGMYNWVSGWGLLGHHVSNFKIYSFTAYMTQYKLKPVRL